MTTRDWKKLCIKLKVTLFDWLDTLPCYGENGEAIRIKKRPIIYFKRGRREELNRRLAKKGMKLVWSTVHYLEGYHHPQGTETACIGCLTKKEQKA